VIDGGSTGGMLWRSPAPTLEPSVVVRLLAEAGGRAARALGTIDNLKYYEARKSR
jgi:hypothetical protein